MLTFLLLLPLTAVAWPQDAKQIVAKKLMNKILSYQQVLSFIFVLSNIYSSFSYSSPQESIACVGSVYRGMAYGAVLIPHICLIVE